MNTPLEDFLQRSAASNPYYNNGEYDADRAVDLDAWGNEWEANDDEDDF